MALGQSALGDKYICNSAVINCAQKRSKIRFRDFFFASFLWSRLEMLPTPEAPALYPPLEPQVSSKSDSMHPESQFIFVHDKMKANPNDLNSTEIASVSNEASKSTGDHSSQPTTEPKAPPLIVKVCIASIGISTLFYVMLFIYLGVSSNQTAYTQNLNIAVGIFDSGQLGTAFQKFAGSVPAGNGLPNLQVVVCPDYMSHRMQNRTALSANHPESCS